MTSSPYFARSSKHSSRKISHYLHLTFSDDPALALHYALNVETIYSLRPKTQDLTKRKCTVLKFYHEHDSIPHMSTHMLIILTIMASQGPSAYKAMHAAKPTADGGGKDANKSRGSVLFARREIRLFTRIMVAENIQVDISAKKALRKLTNQVTTHRTTFQALRKDLPSFSIRSAPFSNLNAKLE